MTVRTWGGMVAEIDELRAELAETIVDRDEWKDATTSANERFKIAEAEIAKLKAQEPAWWKHRSNFHHFAENPPPEIRDLFIPLYLAAGAQGHTREQIGLQLDDRREGLTSHHVYCRVVTEDV